MLEKRGSGLVTAGGPPGMWEKRGREGGGSGVRYPWACTGSLGCLLVLVLIVVLVSAPPSVVEMLHPEARRSKSLFAPA